MRKLITILILTLSLALITGCSDSTSPNENTDDSNDAGTVKLDILFPQDSELSNITTDYNFKEGDTALSILIDYGKKEGIPVVLSSDGIYVSGINGLFERDYGDSYGWLYWIDDESLSVGAAEYELTDGEHVVWKYVDFSEIWN